MHDKRQDGAVLRLENVSKDYYGAAVLQNVNFSLNKGEILGLVGENGAGKTTLSHIIFGMPGIVQSGGYGGTIFVDGAAARFASPFEALDAGIGMVHQEFSLIPGFTAAENIMLNREPVRHNAASALFGPRLATLRRDTMKTRSIGAIGKLGVNIGEETVVSRMPVGHKQFTEIAREIDRDRVKLLILDEPTAVLTESEAGILLDALKALARQGIAIIFVSHRLKEITRVCDRILVLRDGRMIQDIPSKGVTVQNIASWMVGREIDAEPAGGVQPSRRSDDTVLDVSGLWVDMPGETVQDVSFSVKKGEIFGIGGLAGQGKLGIPNGIMGLFNAGGSVLLDGKPLNFNDPQAALSAGLAFVSEDRRGVGLLLDETLELNIAFTLTQIKGACLRRWGPFSLLDEKAARSLANGYIKKLEIKCTGPKQRARELSGGNQQKICLAKAFALEPELLFVSEPTRGIDVGAKKIVLDTLLEYNKKRHATIVMVSSELEELRSVCGRVAIVYKGRIAGILPSDAPPAAFALLMSGETV